MIVGGSEGNRSGLSHLATGEGNHNGLSHSCLNEVPLLPQPLVVPHVLVALNYARVGGWAFNFFSRANTCMRMT